MPFPIFVAHGALGAFDEVIFLSVIAVFVVMIGISWVRSRPLDETPAKDPQAIVPNNGDDDRFQLE